MTRAPQFEPPKGELPVLQYLVPGQLSIDRAYQRSLETSPSQGMIRRIAQHWNWALCQPLVVSRRDGGYFVIDGQHRLAAANLRGDLQVLPCVVVAYDGPEAEAAAFVEINKARQPLKPLDIFRARVASGDEEAVAIDEAITRAGLRLTTHSNNQNMEPGSIGNIGGIQRAWRAHGPFTTGLALEVLSRAYVGQKLRYAGTIFPGIAAIIAEDGQDFGFVGPLIDMLAERGQEYWRDAIGQERVNRPDLKFHEASETVLSDHWDEALGAHLELEAA